MQCPSIVFSKIIGLPAKACENLGGVRYASKKAGGSTKWQGSLSIGKHRGLKRQDGMKVEAGTIVVLQRTLRFFPGLNVGFGRNGSLFAMLPGTVKITCEKTNPKWTHNWIARIYGSRQGGPAFYKKYINVIPKPQHNRFKLIETV